MLFVDEFCGILVYIKFGADVTSQYEFAKGGIKNGQANVHRSVCIRTGENA